MQVIQRPNSGDSTDANRVRCADAPTPASRRLRHGPVRVLALALLLTLGMTTALAAAETASTGASYRVATGDRLTVTVFGQPELSGDFSVDGTGTMMLPLIGEVAVDDLTVKEVEQRVVQRLGEGFLQQPAVSVRVAEFRPIYVLGDVKTPGSYPYRQGTLVVSAIAMAGGFGVTETAQTTVRAEFLLADERLRVLEATRRALLVRNARLEAQRDGATVFRPPAIAATAGSESLDQLIAGEQETLASQAKALQQELTLLRDQKPRLQAQIKGIREQADAEVVQLKLIQSHIEDFNKLMSSGLARRYTGIELQREEARNKGNIGRFAAEMAQLEFLIGELALKIQQAQNAYQQRVMTELAETRTRLREVETTIPTAQEVREARIQQGGMLVTNTTNTPEKPGRSIVVTRRRKNEVQTLAATEATPILPGDVIEVRRDPPSPQSVALTR